LEKEYLALRYTSIDGGRIRNGNLGMEGERKREKKIGEGAGEVYEMGSGVEGKIPEYIMKEELQREKLRNRTGKRV